MGGGSSSSSQQQETNTQNLNLQDLDGVTVAGSDTVSVTSTDFGAVEAGINLGIAALDGVSQQSRDLFDFLKVREEDTLQNISSAASDNLAYLADFSQQALTTTKTTESQQALSSLIKLGSVVAVVAAGAYVLKRG